jgi:ribonuclease Z
LTWLVQARLFNGPFYDPGLFIDFRFGRRALLFDLGETTSLSARELVRVSHAFVSHMHMDHFAGFDRLLRLLLYRPSTLWLIGPPGLVRAVEAKLAAYTWNLLGEESVDFAITAVDYGGNGFVRAGSFRAREGFRRRDAEPPPCAPGIVLDEEEFRIEAAVLDHGTPCLAFALQEKIRVNVVRQGLAELGLVPGPWLKAAKRAVRAGAPADLPITVSPELTLPLGRLGEKAIRTAPGQRIAYIVDAACHEENLARMQAIALGADQLFIEAAFMDEDRGLAASRRHLTARQAGGIARRAGVARLVPFHFSTRYVMREQDLRDEVEAAFAGREQRQRGSG